MTTVTAPVSVRDEALHIVRRHLGETASPMSRLEEIGARLIAELLIDLEGRFDIGLDADEVLPGCVEVLLQLVELRARDRRQSVVHHWDDERARRGLPLFAPSPRLVAVGDGIVRADPPEPQPADATPPKPAPAAPAHEPEPAYASSGSDVLEAVRGSHDYATVEIDGQACPVQIAPPIFKGLDRPLIAVPTSLSWDREFARRDRAQRRDRLIAGAIILTALVVSAWLAR